MQRGYLSPLLTLTMSMILHVFIDIAQRKICEFGLFILQLDADCNVYTERLVVYWAVFSAGL
jgi:hypothetical protein